MWHQIPHSSSKAPEEARRGGPGGDGRPLVPLDRSRTRRADAAPKRHDPSTPVAATSSIKDNRNLGPLAPLHAPLLLLLLPLRVADPLFHIIGIYFEVLLLVEALDDLLRREGRDVHYFI